MHTCQHACRYLRYVINHMHSIRRSDCRKQSDGLTSDVLTHGWLPVLTQSVSQPDYCLTTNPVDEYLKWFPCEGVPIRSKAQLWYVNHIAYTEEDIKGAIGKWQRWYWLALQLSLAPAQPAVAAPYGMAYAYYAANLEH